jgi:hypothetical protein
MAKASNVTLETLLGANPARPGRKPLSHTGPTGATAGKRTANELGSSDWGGSLESATGRPSHRREPGSRHCLHRQGDSPYKAPASSGRQLNYAEVNAVHARVVAGRPVKEASAGVDASPPFPNKNGASLQGKGGRNEKASRGTPPVSNSSRKAPLLAYTWTLTPPSQTRQVGGSKPQPKVPPLHHYPLLWRK